MRLSPLEQEKIYERLKKVETIQEEHTKLLDAQISKNEALTRLTVLMERQMEDNKEREKRQDLRDKKQNQQMDKFSETLVNVNNNLTNLNTNQQQMKQDMNEIGTRVSDIERLQEEQKIDPVKLFKAILSYIATGLGSIGIAVAIWYLTK
jgi:hypothetical protein